MSVLTPSFTMEEVERSSQLPPETNEALIYSWAFSSTEISCSFLLFSARSSRLLLLNSSALAMLSMVKQTSNSRADKQVTGFTRFLPFFYHRMSDLFLLSSLRLLSVRQSKRSYKQQQPKLRVLPPFKAKSSASVHLQGPGLAFREALKHLILLRPLFPVD